MELLQAQQEDRDLEPHVSSQRAAELPDPPHPLDHFPGHAAWIDGDWKLHRIAGSDGVVSWGYTTWQRTVPSRTILQNKRTRGAARWPRHWKPGCSP